MGFVLAIINFHKTNFLHWILGKVCEKLSVNNLSQQFVYPTEVSVRGCRLFFFKCKVTASADLTDFLCLITLSR